MKQKSTYLFLLTLLIVFSPRVFAQLNYQPGGFSTSAGTYTDLDVNGTIIPVANNDDAFSAPQPIGFTFNFNGAPYDSFVFSTNGFIKLGRDSASRHYLFTTMAQPPANGPFTAATSPAPLPGDTSMLFAFGQDLWGGTNNPEFRVFTDGVFGSRICTIQWKNVKDKLQAATGGLWDTINFQIRLHESTNVIEYVYGKWTSTISNPVARFSAVGLVGNSVTTLAQNLHLVKGSTVAWNAAVAVTGFYANNAVNYRNPTSTPAGPAPDNGRTYRFTPLTLNDASVRAVYARGRIPIGFYQPEPIGANIYNPGINTLNNLTVTLTISGANNHTATTTITSLAPGANTTVYFPAYMPTATGPGLITVSVPNDDNNANNESIYSYAVGDYRAAITDTLIPHTGSNGTTIPNFWGARYFIANTGIITTVRSFLVSNSDATGDTVCGVVMDTLGKVLGRSASRIVQASDLGTTMVFHMQLPPTITNNAVIVGIAGGQTVNGLNYFLGTSQTENPIRPGNAFYFMTQTAPGGATNLAVGSTYANPVVWGTTRLMMECEVRPIPELDVLVSEAAPASNFKVPTGTALPLTAVVKNTGSQTRPSGIQVYYRVGSGPIVGPLTTSVSINPGDTTSVVFTGANALNFATAGTYTVKIYTTLLNDSIPANDTLTVTYVAQAPVTIPYRIDNNLMGSWTVENPALPIWKNSTAFQPNGTVNGNVLFADNIVTPNGNTAKIISPFFNFTGLSRPTLHFYVSHAANIFVGSDDTLEVLVSTDGGYTYNTVWLKSSTSSAQQLATDTSTGVSYSPTYVSDWRQETVDLSAYSGMGQVLVAFRDRSAFGNSIYINNVSITNPVSTSVQQVVSASIYNHSNLTVTMNGIGAANADMVFSKYNSAPFSNASPVYASNTTATTTNNSIFTPNHVSQMEWYRITYSGTGPAYPPSSVPFTVMFDVNSVPGITQPDSVYVMQRANYNAPWVALSTSSLGASFISAITTGFGDFALGSTTTANALPVSRLNITGKNISRTRNHISWNTASESNNHFFSVERSFDQVQFTEVGRVKGQGNSTTASYYNYTDEFNGGFLSQTYYRLKQVDFDGKETYSPVIAITPEGTEHDIIVTNPFECAPEVTIRNNGAGTNMQVLITDVSGRLVSSGDFQINPGTNRLLIHSFESLQSGIYMMNIRIGDHEWVSRKLIKN